MKNPTKKCSYCEKPVGNVFNVSFKNNPRRTIRKCGRWWCEFKRWIGYLTLDKATKNVIREETLMKVMKNAVK